MTTKNDSLAIVPLNISGLEAVKVDRSGRLTEFMRKRLAEILDKRLQMNRELLFSRRREVEDQVIAAEKEKAGLHKFRADLDKIEEEIETLRSRAETIRTRCQNATGFHISGELLSSPHYGKDEEARLWAAKNRAGMMKSDAIRQKVDLAVKVVDRFSTKFDKVETRLACAMTIGEAMDIMSSVLGNGDDILEPEDIAAPAPAETED